MGALRFLALGFAVCMALTSGAVEADELDLPYACTMDKGVPHLAPSEIETYRIIGLREEQPFTACASSAAWTCEQMMVHKFTLDCGGQRVPWAKVAASARALGVAMPDRLPPGFAPVSKLRGRIVLPGFGKTASVPRVMSETLSPDAVIEPAAPRYEAKPAPWVTVVDPIAAPASSGGALKVAGVISSLLASLLALCLLLARRRPFPVFEFSTGTASVESVTGRIWEFAAAWLSAFMAGIESRRVGSPDPGGSGGDANVFSHALASIRERLHDTEHVVSTLPSDLLLRDVLISELDGLHHRIADLELRAGKLGHERIKLAIRAVTRDLDRISRIAEGAKPASEETQAPSSASEVPSTVFEAYRILGLNPDAPDAAVKKIVDALRMSWHPDHGRDDADRRYREQRIKQVNAAWDLLKDKLAQAA